MSTAWFGSDGLPKSPEGGCKIAVAADRRRPETPVSIELRMQAARGAVHDVQLTIEEARAMVGALDDAIKHLAYYDVFRREI